ncbi:MAG: RsmE family RNA methyltransferase [Halanaerobiales bacterium]
MHRFFINHKNIKENKVIIKGNDYKHLAYSLRLKKGDQFIVCSGDGKEITVELIKFYDNKVEGKIIKKSKSENEPQLKITLAQAIPKNRNMELVVQKCTEIGVNTIIPLNTKRTIVKLTEKKEKKRINRWQRIAREAAKQSQRAIIPKITEVKTLKSLNNNLEIYDNVFCFWTGDNSSNIRNKISNSEFINKQLLILIGPEGGFSKKEINFIRKNLNGDILSLGPRILRTETAGIVVPALILHEAGEME